MFSREGKSIFPPDNSWSLEYIVIFPLGALSWNLGCSNQPAKNLALRSAFFRPTEAYRFVEGVCRRREVLGAVVQVGARNTKQVLLSWRGWGRWVTDQPVNKIIFTLFSVLADSYCMPFCFFFLHACDVLLCHELPDPALQRLWKMCLCKRGTARPVLEI